MNRLLFITLGFVANSCIGFVSAQSRDNEPIKDLRAGPDRVAKLAEVYRRSFDENLNAIVLEDGALGNLSIFTGMTPGMIGNDYFTSVFHDPRARRMHESLAEMTEEERNVALDQVNIFIEEKFELLQTNKDANYDDRLAHGLRCLLFLLEEYDDERFYDISTKFLTVDQHGRELFSARRIPDTDDIPTVESGACRKIDVLFVVNLNLLKLTREVGLVSAKDILLKIAERTMTEPVNSWEYTERIWGGQTEKVFTIVLPFDGVGAYLSHDKAFASKFLEELQNAKLESTNQRDDVTFPRSYRITRPAQASGVLKTNSTRFPISLRMYGW